MTPTDIAARLTVLASQREEFGQAFNAQLAQLDLDEKRIKAQREQLVQSANHQFGVFDGREALLKEWQKESAPAAPAAPRAVPSVPEPAAPPAAAAPVSAPATAGEASGTRTSGGSADVVPFAPPERQAARPAAAAETAGH